MKSQQGGEEIVWGPAPQESRVPDSTVRRNAASLEAVDNLLGDLFVGDDDDGLGPEALGEIVAHLDQVWATHGLGVVNDGGGDLGLDGVEERPAKGLLGLPGGPDQLGRTALVLDVAEEGPDARAGGDDHDAVEAGGDAHDAAGGKAAHPDVRGRPLDAVLGPVAGVRHDQREPPGTVLYRFGSRDRGEGVPLEQRAPGQPDEAAVDGNGVAEMQSHGVVGEDLGLDGDLLEEQPGRGDAHGRHDQDPEAGGTDAGGAQRRVRRSSPVVGAEDDLHPEEGEHGPADEPVRLLKEVVVRLAERGPGERNGDGEEAREHPRHDLGSRGLVGGGGGGTLWRELTDGVADVGGQEPGAGRDGGARVDAAEVEDVCAALPDGEGPGPGRVAGEGVEGVDDEVLAGEDGDEEVDGREGAEPGPREPGGDGGERDGRGDVQRADEGEQAAVDDGDAVDEAAVGPGPGLGGDVPAEIGLLVRVGEARSGGRLGGAVVRGEGRRGSPRRLSLPDGDARLFLLVLLGVTGGRGQVLQGPLVHLAVRGQGEGVEEVELCRDGVVWLEGPDVDLNGVQVAVPGRDEPVDLVVDEQRGGLGDGRARVDGCGDTVELDSKALGPLL
ncbi:hypothetical protein CTA1_645 [Colletotrichum tanaceti]|uniref:Uncharacterized protein n=1 Tax=Colletotrichum tanaceti TaxID=1306861 RepID=A0A4U6XSU0_9PEZI|nr:hypothetical protein CTA1_645 [Colletotrichum tanaceti]